MHCTAIYRSHHSRLSGPLIYFPSLLFCINRTSGFLFLKCFLAGQPILTAVLEKVTHMFHSSPFCLSPAERKGAERQWKRWREGDSPSWLRMIKSSGLSRPAGTDDTTKLQRVKDSRRRKEGAGGRKHRERNCNPKPVLTNWCWVEPEILRALLPLPSPHQLPHYTPNDLIIS